MSDRDAILGRIRRTLGPRSASARDIAAAAAALVADPGAIQPTFARDDLAARFIAKATSDKVTATVDCLTSASDVPDALRQYLDGHGVPHRVAIQPHDDLQALNWAGMTTLATPPPDGGVAVTQAEYGIAETGSVVVRSGTQAPVLLNFLPLYHVVVLYRDTLLACSEDLWPHLGGADSDQPRLLTLVTGTSGTADIEARNIRGAHGPRYLHILLVDGSAA